MEEVAQPAHEVRRELRFTSLTQTAREVPMTLPLLSGGCGAGSPARRPLVSCRRAGKDAGSTRKMPSHRENFTLPGAAGWC